MTPDMEEVVERLEQDMRLSPLFRRPTSSRQKVAVGEDDLRALLSAHRKMVEALESIARRTEPHPDDTLADTAKDALKANAIAKAALTGSREHG